MVFDCFIKKVGVFVDGPNMLRKDSKVDLALVKKEASKYGFVSVANVYLDQHAPQKLIEAVINQGFRPVIASGDIDVAMATDIVFHTLRDKLSTVVVATRDTDFVPAIARVKELGKRVVVVATPKGFSKALEHHADELIIVREMYGGKRTAGGSERGGH